ncbi:hypothetical protein B0T22DRAFT_180251 [Podospora appendiculata]|uniref:Secreted protein n=1 Tax=Podospora appendiculata TaxID=314037 RepID=A0AAE0XBZ1_9PEZI|nr:hypothetical protein B0T22DRAFT_180251 [Podospora appendiculata]
MLWAVPVPTLYLLSLVLPLALVFRTERCARGCSLTNPLAASPVISGVHRSHPLVPTSTPPPSISTQLDSNRSAPSLMFRNTNDSRFSPSAVSRVCPGGHDLISWPSAGDRLRSFFLSNIECRLKAEQAPVQAAKASRN